MKRDRDSGDSGTLTHELKLKNLVTSVTEVVTVTSQCHPTVTYHCHHTVTYRNEAK